MSETKNRDFKMQAGDSQARSPQEPMLSVVGNRKTTYLWVGSDADDNRACFASIAGPRTLKKLADEIYERLGYEPPKVSRSR